MTKKLVALWLAVIVLFVLTGGKLARVDAEENENNDYDRLVGVLVTREALNLFDFERYFNDNVKKIANGGSFLMDDNNEAYEGRIYGTLVSRTDDNTDDTAAFMELDFEGLEGTLFYCIRVNSPDNSYSTSVSNSDEAISDGKIGVHASDDGETINMEATIYTAPNDSILSFFLNPIYQSADGRYYVMSGTGSSMSGDQIGTVLTQTLNKNVTLTENGKSRSDNTTIKIDMAVIIPPERIDVVQMDKNSNMLSRTEYKPGQLPNTLVPETNTEYIIVESYKHDQEGKPVVERSLYDKSSNTIETFYCREDGICIKQHTQVDWK